MKLLKYYNAPQSLIDISVNHKGNGYKYKTVWRRCNKLDDLIWMAQFSGSCTDEDIYPALLACARKIQPFLSVQARDVCIHALNIAEEYLKGYTTKEVLLDASRAAGQCSQTEMDLADKGDPNKFVYDADNYAKAYAAFACASVSYAITKEPLSIDHQDLDALAIAAVDLICVEEYSGNKLNFDTIFKSHISTNLIRIDNDKYQDYCYNTRK